MEFTSIQMENGNLFDGKRIGELVEFIINKFSEEKLSYDEAKIVLNRTDEIMGEYAYLKVESANSLENNQL